MKEGTARTVVVATWGQLIVNNVAWFLIGGLCTAVVIEHFFF